jgi:hypothetical protein
MPDHIVGIVGYRPSEDGTLNAVYVDAAGRQFIVDPKGRRVYGLWYVPPDDTPPPSGCKAEVGRSVERPAARS